MPSRAQVATAGVVAAAAAAAAYYIYRKKRSGAQPADGLVLRSAYQPSQYQIEKVNLNFVLTEEEAVVESVLHFAPGGAGALYLDGEELQLRSIAMNGKPLVKVPKRQPR